MEGDGYRHGLVETIYLSAFLVSSDSPGDHWLIEGFIITSCMYNYEGGIS